MRNQQRSRCLAAAALLLLSDLTPLASAAANFTTSKGAPSKRGLAYVSNDNAPDNQLLLSNNSAIAWYYTWSLWQAPAVGDGAIFVPLVHGLDEANDELEPTLNRLPERSTHLLTFNEPDGTTDSGGSAIEAKDAAKTYVERIAPLRNSGRGWKISHPVVTGSGRGLDWLRDFNQSCWELDSRNGCPADFVAVHWYGDYLGLTGWLKTLREFYSSRAITGRDGVQGDKLKFWITEMALPQGEADATLAMMNSTLPYLDSTDWVEAYAWFGAFRSNDANAWTGEKVSLFDSGGGLTDIGALYLGGEENGFQPGMKGEGASAAPSSRKLSGWLMAISLVAACLMALG